LLLIVYIVATIAIAVEGKEQGADNNYMFARDGSCSVRVSGNCDWFSVFSVVVTNKCESNYCCSTDTMLFVEFRDCADLEHLPRLIFREAETSTVSCFLTHTGSLDKKR